MLKSYLNILLHAHLPFIRHPEYSEFLEERWLFEAISETYLPLLRSLNRLHEDKIPINITLSFSPSLMAMLQDELLQERYIQHLVKMMELGEKELERTRREGHEFVPLVQIYLDLFSQNYQDFLELYNRNILAGFGRLAQLGEIELITTVGTYPFLPFYEHYPESIQAQFDVTQQAFARSFGGVAQGVWLPEAGYFPGLEKYLRDCGVRYFYTSAHAVLFSPDVPRSGLYAPVTLPNGLHAFPRDLSTVSLVWSSKSGYPSDPVYREFYRDIGHDLDLAYVSPYIHLEKTRINTGYKYYAISGDTAHKQPYDPALAKQKIKEHAQNFVFHHLMHFKKVQPLMSVPPISSSPYNAELLGHRWFEGVDWLEAILRELAKQGDQLSTILPLNYLAQYPQHQKVSPIFSSWGNKGYAETWLEGSNDWIYRHLHMAIDRMVELVDRFPDVTGLKRRALNQAAREVLLTQSIDWPVIMRNGTASSYAASRIKEHLANFYHIYDAMGEGKMGTDWLTKVERKNNIFPDINYMSFHNKRRRSN